MAKKQKPSIKIDAKFSNLKLTDEQRKALRKALQAVGEIFIPSPKTEEEVCVTANDEPDVN